MKYDLVTTNPTSPTVPPTFSVCKRKTGNSVQGKQSFLAGVGAQAQTTGLFNLD